ncbi:MAG: hypothetical protein MJ172_11315 [Clostridia bacterium]|nr:hypothetical protein [Clostridia bacterium]
MKVVNSETYWRPINQFEIESVIKHASQECGYHKVGACLFIAVIVTIFVLIAVSISISDSWSALSLIVFILTFLLLISLPVYLIVKENRKLKMIIDGKVRCMTITVLRKRIGGTKGGGLYLVGINRPDASKLTKGKTVREYDVSKKTYNATQVKGKGLLIRFDTDSEEKSGLRYRFLPLS